MVLRNWLNGLCLGVGLKLFQNHWILSMGWDPQIPLVFLNLKAIMIFETNVLFNFMYFGMQVSRFSHYAYITSMDKNFTGHILDYLALWDFCLPEPFYPSFRLSILCPSIRPCVCVSCAEQNYI